jgi:hypothetical protein
MAAAMRTITIMPWYQLEVPQRLDLSPMKVGIDYYNKKWKEKRRTYKPNNGRRNRK